MAHENGWIFAAPALVVLVRGVVYDLLGLDVVGRLALRVGEPGTASDYKHPSACGNHGNHGREEEQGHTTRRPVMRRGTRENWGGISKARVQKTCALAPRFRKRVPA